MNFVKYRPSGRRLSKVNVFTFPLWVILLHIGVGWSRKSYIALSSEYQLKFNNVVSLCPREHTYHTLKDKKAAGNCRSTDEYGQGKSVSLESVVLDEQIAYERRLSHVW